jgi:hypothetical protein
MLASDLLWHINGREATAAVGYDVTLRQARLQGKIDSTGVLGRDRDGVRNRWVCGYRGVKLGLALRCLGLEWVHGWQAHIGGWRQQTYMPS